MWVSFSKDESAGLHSRPLSLLTLEAYNPHIAEHSHKGRCRRGDV
jgi:hypothetical protein